MVPPTGSGRVATFRSASASPERVDAEYPAPPESRARVRPTVAERVDEIAAMMRDGKYQRGVTSGVLAEAWGLSVSRVEDLTAEAWRRVCAEADDPTMARPNIAGILATNLAKADARECFRDVAKLGDIYSRVIGARAPEVRAEVPLSEEQARAKYRELTGHDWPGTDGK